MGEQTFRQGLRSLVRGLWQSVLTKNQFEDEMSFLLEKEISNAWAEGASECGIGPDDYSEAEQTQLKVFIAEQLSYVSGFAEAIVENNKKKDGDIFPLFDRTKLWVNRYSEVVNQAKMMSCQDLKLKWVIGVKGCKEHCSSCLKLNGKVKRASYWDKVGIRPQSSVLECGGWRCCCGFEVTNEPVYRGQIRI